MIVADFHPKNFPDVIELAKCLPKGYNTEIMQNFMQFNK